MIELSDQLQWPSCQCVAGVARPIPRHALMPRAVLLCCVEWQACLGDLRRDGHRQPLCLGSILLSLPCEATWCPKSAARALQQETLAPATGSPDCHQGLIDLHTVHLPSGRLRAAPSRCVHWALQLNNCYGEDRSMYSSANS